MRYEYEILEHNGYQIILDDEGFGDWCSSVHYNGDGATLVAAFGYSFGGPHMTRETALREAIQVCNWGL